jgi:hypothetical protein
LEALGVMSISSGSMVAFLKFLIALPRPLPISGNFLQPKTIRPTTRMTTISCIPKPIIMAPPKSILL